MSNLNRLHHCNYNYNSHNLHYSYRYTMSSNYSYYKYYHCSYNYNLYNLPNNYKYNYLHNYMYHYYIHTMYYIHIVYYKYNQNYNHTKYYKYNKYNLLAIAPLMGQAIHLRMSLLYCNQELPHVPWLQLNRKYMLYWYFRLCEPISQLLLLLAYYFIFNF